MNSGDLVPGERLPSEEQLAESYGASMITVRQALPNLARQGLLSRQPGKGTFVRDTTVTAGPRTVTSFSQEMASLHLRADARVLRLELVAADVETAERLKLEVGAPLVALDRQRLGNGTPFGIQRARLVASLVPGLESMDLGGASLYEVLEERYGLVPTEAEETLRVVPVSGADAALLGVPRGTCCFQVERLTYRGDQPFEYVRSVMRGDRYQVRLGLRASST